MPTHRSDFLVAGSGLAGLLCAKKLSEIGTVALVSKTELKAGNTYLAQGGIAAVTSSDDSIELHIADTMRAGAGLCDEKIVRIVAEAAPFCVKNLMDIGVRFSMKEGRPDLGLEGGHSKRRILHADDFTGREIEETLIKSCRKNANIEIFEHHTAIDLILKSHAKDTFPKDNECYGAYLLDNKTGRIRSFTARYTVLACGGAGKVYKYTSNPSVATGDGMAMAYRAGLALSNMEFVQFHPTLLYHPQAKSFLISEALRGEGGILRLPDGTAFMKKYSPLRELAPRDVVARAIDSELKKSGHEHVYLDMTALKPAFIKKRFPNIHGTCLGFGLDIAREPIPVTPAAHFFCGGVPTDEYGRTELRGLVAVGETACTGLHGANRLASNSLLEACALSHRAAAKIREDVKHSAVPLRHPPAPEWNAGNARPSDEAVVIAQNWEEIRSLMWNYAGIVRSDKRLERAKRRLALITDEIKQYYWDFIITQDLSELRNISCVAEQIVRCAIYRRESRGLHYNIDCPDTLPRWARPSSATRYTAY